MIWRGLVATPCGEAGAEPSRCSPKGQGPACQRKILTSRHKRNRPRAPAYRQLVPARTSAIVFGLLATGNCLRACAYAQLVPDGTSPIALGYLSTSNFLRACAYGKLVSAGTSTTAFGPRAPTYGPLPTGMRLWATRTSRYECNLLRDPVYGQTPAWQLLTTPRLHCNCLQATRISRPELKSPLGSDQLGPAYRHAPAGNSDQPARVQLPPGACLRECA